MNPIHLLIHVSLRTGNIISNSEAKKIAEWYSGAAYGKQEMNIEVSHYRHRRGEAAQEKSMEEEAEILKGGNGTQKDNKMNMQ